MDSIPAFLGLALRAGRLSVGEEPVGAVCRARKASVLLLACDAADNTIRRATHFSEAGNVLCLTLPLTKDALGGCLGRTSCAMAALTDVGLAAALAGKLAAADPAVYGEAAAKLSQKNQRVVKRKKEKQAHEKNLRRGKKPSGSGENT